MNPHGLGFLLKDTLILLPLYLFSHIGDLFNLHNLTEIAQFLSYATSAILSASGSLYTVIKIKAYFSSKKKGKRMSDFD